jgi:beta-alanine degradation protein BauB
MCCQAIRSQRIARGGVLCALAILGFHGACMAQPVAQDFVASPDVYRVRAENDQFRVVEGVWKPGQRDQFHSHPAMGYYWVTDCSVRWHMPDGSTREFNIAAGAVGVQTPVASHAVENIGKAECRVVMFEQR